MGTAAAAVVVHCCRVFTARNFYYARRLSVQLLPVLQYFITVVSSSLYNVHIPETRNNFAVIRPSEFFLKLVFS